MTKKYSAFDPAERYAPALEQASATRCGWIADMEQDPNGEWIAIETAQGKIEYQKSELLAEIERLRAALENMTTAYEVACIERDSLSRQVEPSALQCRAQFGEVCELPAGHDGLHQFRDTNGALITWRPESRS